MLTLLGVAMLLCACSDRAGSGKTSLRVHAFYYPWWGTPETDGEYRHWNHEIMGDVDRPHRYRGGDDIGADFFPADGCYSSNDSVTVDRHMRQMSDAGVGVVTVSWWGRDTFEDRAVKGILNAAERYDLKVNFHLEPYAGRTVMSIRKDIAYLHEAYGRHAALYRDSGDRHLPLFYVYDSYKIDIAQWRRLLGRKGNLTIRGTDLDARIIGLWVEQADTLFLERAGFDGAYTYFASDAFSYGSVPDNWRTMARWAEAHDMLFVPCVGPGYADLRVRPWNRGNQRSRDGGAYFDRMFAAALEIDPDVIGLTSFNEWHEGTQIEPAQPYRTDAFTYQDYQPRDPEYYLERTRFWVDRLMGKPTPSDDRPLSSFVSRLKQSKTHLAVGARLRVREQPHERFTAGGPRALIDGVLGTSNYRDGSWVGVRGSDLAAVVQFPKPTQVRSVTVRFLENSDAWIVSPDDVQIGLAQDGLPIELYARANDSAVFEGREGIGIRTVTIHPMIDDVRIVTVSARKRSADKGQDSRLTWLFIDEVVVE